jgi:hypothetical protein
MKTTTTQYETDMATISTALRTAKILATTVVEEMETDEMGAFDAVAQREAHQLSRDAAESAMDSAKYSQACFRVLMSNPAAAQDVMARMVCNGGAL